MLTSVLKHHRRHYENNVGSLLLRNKLVCVCVCVCVSGREKRPDDPIVSRTSCCVVSVQPNTYVACSRNGWLYSEPFNAVQNTRHLLAPYNVMVILKNWTCCFCWIVTLRLHMWLHGPGAVIIKFPKTLPYKKKIAFVVSRITSATESGLGPL